MEGCDFDPRSAPADATFQVGIGSPGRAAARCCGGTMNSTSLFFRAAPSASQPNVFSDCVFQSITRPSASIEMNGSYAVSTNLARPFFALIFAQTQNSAAWR